MGHGMGQGRARRSAGKGLCRREVTRGLTPQVGGGEDLLVVRAEQEDEQGLREALRQREAFVCTRP